MPVVNRIADYAEEMTAWRRHLHRHPELRFDCQNTAAFIAERLRAFGVDEIHEGIATSGLVAIIEGQGEGPTIGLRADMDALPIEELTGADYASTVPGRMHACGHDGHVTMLLGAARYLAETRRFAGRVALLFQPAEEDGGGGEVMVREGVMDRFGISQVYGIHNAPNVPLGRFVTAPGPLMAAVDTATVRVIGKGGHGATPHETVDPVVAIVGMVSALQTIISRNLYTLDDLVLSVTQIHTGSASNIIPEDGWFCATIRTFTPEVRDLVRRRFHEIVEGHAAAYGVRVEIDYELGYPPTVNDPAKAGFAAEVAAEIAGEAGVEANANREMGSEDFAYMLEARPGAYLFLGTGPGAGLHHPAYDFNDAASPLGASFFARLVERAQPLEA
ncbi:amidohydrolase [Rhodobacter sphaeroides]|jgi:hippurate hydrolase|uniref:Metal-dependent amidase/aminoacylase/carboxypeptidase n=2 Tax=Cereibacter sphaeroides TaxID=1063 RepID=Q3J2B3_CERS4|nr:M20 aminoacylase family protein [Cereibacter sphaeroides]ABN76665.1 amidohydrolase [Cereibacter sphaeroides ATCC 17029]EKX56582.1 Catalyzes the cleavage of p-aminobenzoyl-glutamate to p-aminobenzoate and glutamate, subunit A [Rhodobacter sp. AKP1]ABA79071.1 putative Metal-dependent amidase/aminoacylase/carboxypeptidase [Cereibacter sphaeroides 2.4.1]AMJ47390.1 amidohydrolase [Cereibacter sphaeroides]ANS34103.1 amidohydrolase [Cereibacter sphaeroides]